MELTIWTDGGSRGNPGPAAAGLIIQDNSGSDLFAGGFFLGHTTNNVAEYEGLNRALEIAHRLGGTTLKIFCDSELVVKQVNGQYRVKNAQLKQFFQQVLVRINEFESVHLEHVLREDNADADRMVNWALDTEADVGGMVEQGQGRDKAESSPPKIASKNANKRYDKPMAMIVVTGGAGFIGSALVWALNQRGFTDILVVDALDTAQSWQNLTTLKFADYLDKDDFLRLLEEGKLAGKIDGILHLGACSSTTQRDVGFLMRNNYEYSKRLALWCCRNQKRLVYASSAATYGDGSRGFSDRHERLQDLQPLNGYAFSKWLFDLWALRMGLLDSIAGLKYFNVFGPNEYHKQDMRSVAHKAFEQIQKEGKVRLFKSHRPDYRDGWQLRDFVYVKDAVSATLAIYDKPSANGIYNIGTGQARSFYDLIAAVFNAMDRQPQIEYIDMPQAIRDKYQYHTCAETDKLRKIFPQPMLSLEEAVNDYVRSYLLSDQPHLI